MEHSLFDIDKINQIKSRLAEKSETLAVAESVTAGLLQFAFSSADSARDYFQGGISAYNLGQKSRHLHVEPIHAESCNCVSENIAREMALNVTRLFSSNWGVGVTGYATIDPAIKMKQPFAYFAITHNNQFRDSGFLKHKKGDP